MLFRITLAVPQKMEWRRAGTIGKTLKWGSRAGPAMYCPMLEHSMYGTRWSYTTRWSWGAEEGGAKARFACW